MRYVYDYDRRFAASKAESLIRIHRLVAKYARMLEVTELPKVAIRNNLRSTWLGRLTFRRGQQNVMDIQEAVLADEASLERVVAHEMAHHVEMLSLTEADFAKLKVGIRPASHGSVWLELAAKINSVMGAGFVTKNSDASYSVATETKPYFILITLGYDGPYFWYAVGVRLSPKSKSYAERSIAGGGKLIRTMDPLWSQGASIGKGWSISKDPEVQAKLAVLFHSS